MIGDTTNVLGIEIPSTAPIFLAVMAFHVLFGLCCVISGAVAMLSEKGKARHLAFGKIYYWFLTAVFGSASVLAIIRWAEDYHLFVLGALSFLTATLGRSAARGHWPSSPRLHIVGMGLSYIILLTAFYVDNGKNLPLWRDLPPVAYWTVPAAVGLPIMIWALLQHRFVRAWIAASRRS